MEASFGYLLKDQRATPFVPWTGSQSATVAPAHLLAAVGSIHDPDPIDPFS